MDIVWGLLIISCFLSLRPLADVADDITGGGSLCKTVELRTRELREHEVELRNAKDAAELAREHAENRQSREEPLSLANMSHELRTPINSILGYAQPCFGGLDLTDDEKRN